MYKLENNVQWTDELKNAFRHNVTRGKIIYKSDNTVSGEGEVVTLNGIENGKNLYSSVLEIGSINTSTGINENSNNCIRSKDYIKVEPNTVYTIQNNNNYQEILYFYDNLKSFISVNSSLGNGAVTFTTPANCYYLKNRTSANKIENDLTTKFQLELGSMATTYEPYTNKFIKFGVKGNYKQFTSTGKNLWGGFNLTTGNSNTMTFAHGKDGTITINGTANTQMYSLTSGQATSYLKTLPAGTYTISGNATNDINIQVINSTGTQLASTNNSTGTTFTLEQETQVFVRVKVASGITANNLVIKIQLENSSVATDYESYTYGQAPNPNYECPVYAVGDSGNVNVKIVNKNLFDGEIETGTLDYGQPTVNSNMRRSKNFIAIKPNESYVFSINGIANRVVVNFYDDNYNWINISSTAGMGLMANTGIFTTPENAKFIKWRGYQSDTELLTNGKIQLEKGSTTTEYTLHQEQTFTMPCQQPMVTEEDYFNWDNKKEIHGWKKLVLDGTENWSFDSNSLLAFRLTLSDAKQFTTSTSIAPNVLCNSYTPYKWANLSADYAISATNAVPKMIAFRNKDITTLNDWKAYLAQQYANNTPVYVWYKLETAEELTFTTEQNTVAEQIENAISYYEQTNVFSIDNVSPNFDITAYTNENVEINYDNGLKEITIEDNVYVPDLGFIGQATAKKATVLLLDNEQTINLENKEFDIYIGADYNNQTYYINYGRFIVNEPPENDSTNGTIKVIAYDYMLKFNKIYEDQVIYPLSLKKYLINICKQAGVMLATESFINEDFSVTDNQFEGKQLREILKHIGKSAFSWARIGQDSRLYLDFKKSETVEGFNLFEPTLEIDGTTIATNNCSVSLENDVLAFNATGTDMYWGAVTGTGNSYNNGKGQLIEIPSSEKIYLECSNSNFDKNFITFYDKNKKSLGYTQISSSVGSLTIPNNAVYCTIRIGKQNSVSGTTYKTTVKISTFADIFTIDDYKLDGYKKANEYYGPINKVTYGDSDIQGQELSVPNVDPENVKELVINDNYFGYTLAKRQELIQGGTVLFGFTYMPVSQLDLTGAIYLDCTDAIKVKAGRNLWGGFNLTTGNVNTMSFEYDEDGTITINGTASTQMYSLTSGQATSYLKTLPAGIYTISGNATNDINIQVVNSTGTQLASTNNSTGTTFTLEQETQVFVRVKVASGVTVNNLVIKIQLENSSVATEYEPYNEIITRVFSHTIKYNGIISDTVTTEGISDNQQTYENMNTPVSNTNRTEISVDRANKKIQSIVSEIGDRSQKTTTITQDVDRIESKVDDIEDLTREVSGNKTVTISDAYAGANILELHIYGNNNVFKYLYPANNLYPANDLFPYGDSKIRFHNDVEDRTIDLGVLDVLRANNEVRDEVYIENTNVYLIRRVNTNGTTKTTEEKTLLGNLDFILQEGDNTFEIVNYTAPIMVKYAIKSDYTDVFATKVEMNSSITQTAEEINLQVSKKVDENEVISKINQSAEQIQIEADKISLARKRN